MVVDLRNLVPWLLFLHVLAAVTAIGPNFAFSTIRALGRGDPPHVNFATRISHAISMRLVYPIGLVIPATGISMILILGSDLTAREFWWLDLAIALYTGVYLYSFFVQRRIVERIIAMTAAPPPAGGGPPIALTELASRAKRGGSVMLALLGAVVFLMVMKPQL